MHDDVVQMRLTFADVVLEAAGQVVGFWQRHVGGDGDAYENDQTAGGVQQPQLPRRRTGPVYDEPRDPLPLGVIGITRAYFASEDGRQSGDPAKAAAAIITAVDADEPPLRLVLGADAVEGIRAKYEELSAELARWEPLAFSTGFEP